jgi:hypothetical protein
MIQRTEEYRGEDFLTLPNPSTGLFTGQVAVALRVAQSGG